MDKAFRAAHTLRRGVASPTSGTLAYTCLCLVALFFVVCVQKMPSLVLERVEYIRGLLS
jgi:hypothetical protein